MEIDASIVFDVILWYILYRSCRNVTMGWSQDPGPPNGGEDTRHFVLRGFGYERVEKEKMAKIGAFLS